MGKLSRDRRDIYYRMAKEEGYRARSAYKLLQLDDICHFLSPPPHVLRRRQRQQQREQKSQQQTNQVVKEQQLRQQTERQQEGDKEEEKKNQQQQQHDEEGEEEEEQEQQQQKQGGGGEEEIYPQRAVDLCAAPGSWSQVLRRRLYENYRHACWLYECQSRKKQQQKQKQQQQQEQQQQQQQEEQDQQEQPQIVAVDLQEIAPIEGVHILQGDITQESTAIAILSFFQQQPADIVVCDGAPDVTGLHDIDEYVQAELLNAALSICCRVLRHGGCFVCKFFRGEQTPFVYSKLLLLFRSVKCCKPAASRNSSIEAFLVCKGFKQKEIGEEHYLLSSETEVEEEEELQQLVGGCLVPFLACGDLRGFDADRNYTHISKSKHGLREPQQPPLHPPYEEALLDKRRGRTSSSVGILGSYGSSTTIAIQSYCGYVVSLRSPSGGVCVITSGLPPFISGSTRSNSSRSILSVVFIVFTELFEYPSKSVSGRLPHTDGSSVDNFFRKKLCFSPFCSDLFALAFASFRRHFDYHAH
ncbi:putative tRNA (cytidine(32)/guanosine(34)-2'-O)-methyltransferase [Ochotona princeps]|uniref:putative tRNA (cytidine(32)/guanosine(34)-2'-O)-methyltransferase n=1 Tax=Ochotona princeps TaxID=9978 RepID=UPI00271539D7|nr:putative tRNA (cytidine(32)/guanosine(34)-2'-O)-methyltransferase [Ochotona princeps]